MPSAATDTTTSKKGIPTWAKVGIAVAVIVVGVAVLVSVVANSSSHDKKAISTSSKHQSASREKKSGPTTASSRTTTTRVATTTAAAPTTTTVNPAAIEFVYKTSATTPPYDELVKNPNPTGSPVHYRAKVFQYDTRTGPADMLVEVTRGDYDLWTDFVLVDMSTADMGNGIDNNDIIDFWGDPAGPYSYDTSGGGTNTVPKVATKFVSLVSKG